MIHDRKTGVTAPEIVYQNSLMGFLYNTTLGGLCVLFLRLPLVSKLYGLGQRTRRSRNRIASFIAAYNIDMRDYPSGYNSFNDFITRKRTRETIDQNPNHLIAPADSCMSAYPINPGATLTVKNKLYTLARFLRDDTLAQTYTGGVCLVFRLRVYDDHRFCFVDDSLLESRKHVRGFLDSVNTNATGRFTLSSNARDVSVWQTARFGRIVWAEVGAMLVGRIIQTHTGAPARKGDEKGYFEFGGSSIVLLLKQDAAIIDPDILAHSVQGIETKVTRGEKIGESYV